MMEPPAIIVTGRTAALDDLMVAAAAAHITRPAAMARFLAVNMAISEPTRLGLAVYAAIDSSQVALGIANKAVAGGQVSIGGNAEIAGSGATRIRPVGPFMNFAQRVYHVGKRITLS